MSDARWGDPREYDGRDRSDEWPRVYDPRDPNELDPRDELMRDLDSMPRRQCWQDRTRRCVRRRAGAVAADSRLHAPGEGSDSPRLGAAACRSERTDEGRGAPRQIYPAEARRARRGVSLLRVDRPHQLQPPT